MNSLKALALVIALFAIVMFGIGLKKITTNTFGKLNESMKTTNEVIKRTP